MEKMGDEAAARFINALIKSVQTLCHGYLEFENGIEIIGHINLSVDKGGSLDYILKEKVCKNAENSTLFISNSFHAEPKGEQEVAGKQPVGQTVQNSESADSRGKVSSAISSITSNLTGIRDRRRSSFGAKDSESPHGHHRSGKRKASTDESGDVCPPKVSSHHDGSNLSSDSTYQHNSSSPIDSKLGLHDLADGVSSETLLPQTANVTDHTDIGVNLAGSVLEPVDNQNTDLGEREEDSDGDLEVTFIKEEYVEGDRSACDFDNSSQQYVGGPHDRNSEGMVDPSVFPVSLHSSSAPSTYVPSAHDPSAVGQHYSGGVPSQPQPGPSGTRGRQWGQGRAQTFGVGRSGAGGPPRAFPTGRGFNPGRGFSPARGVIGPRKRGALVNPATLLQCDLCSATFTSKSGLVGHKNRVHFNRHPYKCNVCMKGFSVRELYLDHLNMHNNIKAHACPYCSSLFTYKASLRQHLREKSGSCKFKKLAENSAGDGGNSEGTTGQGQDTTTTTTPSTEQLVKADDVVDRIIGAGTSDWFL